MTHEGTSKRCFQTIVPNNSWICFKFLPYSFSSTNCKYYLKGIDPLSIEPFESLYTEGKSFLHLTFKVEDLHDTT